MSYDYTAELEEELDDVSGGRLDWQKLLADSGATSSRRPAKSWTRSLARSPRPSMSSLRLGCTRRARTEPIRGSVPSAATAGCPARRQVRRVRRLLQLSGMQVHAEVRAGRRSGGARGRRSLATALTEERPLRSVRRARREARIDPEGQPLEDVTPKWPNGYCPFRARSARIRRPGSRSPLRSGATGHLAHDGKYAKLGSTAEVFETGMNAAVAKLADAASGGGRREGGSREPVVLGKHPANGGEIKVMAGRYGPYATDGTTNATLPRGSDPKTITLDEAVRLIDERAAKGPPAKKGRRGPARGKKEEVIDIELRRLPHGEGLPAPSYATDGAAGMDVVAAEDLTLSPGQRHAVATGFAIAIPDRL